MEKSSIENIFRQGLENYEIQPDEDEWSAVDLALPRLNFFRFSFVNFNIYYCSLIVLCFLFSALSLIYTLSGRNVKTQTVVAGEKGIIEYPTFHKEDKTGLKQIIKEDKALASQKVSEEKVKSKSVIKTKDLTGNKNNENLNPITPQGINQDTVGNKEKLQQSIKIDNPTLTDLSQPEQQKKKNVKNKRIVYITKQDTIVVIDTLSKRRPKRKY
ncbi:MAG: hypothetical protein J7604_04635 [Sporocytophaga sp.]|uniref:hypothetical protein n=1 Tax=Sporocytophaga sp. TaxID=2231183 RepID=UPI001B208352|nr:hypothetical protein [Sporocytophaga sp.]MBO9699472.1 hypothetical protein [Sporocytophaga sp.]